MDKWMGEKVKEKQICRHLDVYKQICLLID